MGDAIGVGDIDFGDIDWDIGDDGTVGDDFIVGLALEFRGLAPARSEILALGGSVSCGKVEARRTLACRC